MTSLRNILVVVALIAVLVPSLALGEEKKSKTTELLSDVELRKYQYCGSDSDCMHALNGCCDCANGGADIAVNKERFEVFRERFDCLKVVCGDKEREPPCGSGVITCVDHRCEYVELADVEKTIFGPRVE